MKISRRNLIVGSTAAASATLLGLGRQAVADLAQGDKNLMIVVVSGGWDTTYSVDPKPGLNSIDAPTGEVEEFEGIPVYTSTTRPAIGSFFEAHAGLTTLINGLQVQSLVHTDCAKRVLTGTPSDTAPDVGAIVAYELGNDLPAPYLVLGQTSYTGPYASIAARAGTVNQVSTLLDPEAAFPTADADYTPRFAPSNKEDNAIREFVNARAQREMARRGVQGPSQGRYQDFLDSLERGDMLAAAADFGDFDYTRDLSVQAGIALDVLEQGLSRVVQVEMSGFDTHEYNAQQGDLQSELFAALHAIVDDMIAREGREAGHTLLDDTVVLVVSEMGRTPRLNEEMGKDHWPVTSAMVIGGGSTGGRVIGATNDEFLARKIDLESGEPSGNGEQLLYGSLAAGVLALAGVDPEPHLPGVEPLHAICT